MVERMPGKVLTLSVCLYFESSLLCRNGNFCFWISRHLQGGMGVRGTLGEGWLWLSAALSRRLPVPLKWNLRGQLSCVVWVCTMLGYRSICKSLSCSEIFFFLSTVCSCLYPTSLQWMGIWCWLPLWPAWWRPLCSTLRACKSLALIAPALFMRSMLLEDCPMFPLVLVWELGLGKALKRVGLNSCITCLLGSSFATYLRSSHPQISRCSVPLLMWFDLMGRGSSLPLDNAYSSFQAHVKCFSSEKTFLVPPHLVYMISFCIPRLCCASFLALKAAVAYKCIHCFIFLSFPARLRVSWEQILCFVHLWIPSA